MIIIIYLRRPNFNDRKQLDALTLHLMKYGATVDNSDREHYYSCYFPHLSMLELFVYIIHIGYSQQSSFVTGVIKAG